MRKAPCAPRLVPPLNQRSAWPRMQHCKLTVLSPLLLNYRINPQILIVVRNRWAIWNGISRWYTPEAYRSLSQSKSL